MVASAVCMSGTAYEVSSDPAPNLVASQPTESISRACQPKPTVQIWLLTVVGVHTDEDGRDCSLIFSPSYLADVL